MVVYLVSPNIPNKKNCLCSIFGLSSAMVLWPHG